MSNVKGLSSFGTTKPGDNDVTAEEMRLFELVWMRLGANRPDGQPWTHPQRGFRLSQPRTHNEFVTYIEVVSKYLSVELTAWKGKANKLLLENGKLDDYWRGKVLDAKRDSAQRQAAIQENQHETRRLEGSLNEALSENRDLKRHFELFDALIGKFGREELEKMLEGRTPLQGSKRKIRL